MILINNKLMHLINNNNNNNNNNNKVNHSFNYILITTSPRSMKLNYEKLYKLV